MIERVSEFWLALGRLTFAETMEVAEVFRDAWEVTGDFDSDIQDWAFLLNTARNIADDRAADA